MQPLSYQSAKETCWVTCMINGIRFVSNSPRIETKVYKLLHSLLKSDGVFYYTRRQKKKFDDMIEEIAYYTELKIRSYCGNEVIDVVKELRFNNKAAVCDVGNGEHSILLTGRKDNWIKAFDPWWYDKENRCNDNVRSLEKCMANVMIRENHLLEDRLRGHTKEFRQGEAYPIGEKICTKFLTLIKQK